MFFVVVVVFSFRFLFDFICFLDILLEWSNGKMSRQGLKSRPKLWAKFRVTAKVSALSGKVFGGHKKMFSFQKMLGQG